VVSSTLRPHFTPGKDPTSILQEAGWAPGPVWTDGKSRPHRDSIQDRPARSQSLYRLSSIYIYIYIYTYMCTHTHTHIYIRVCVCVCVCVRKYLRIEAESGIALDTAKSVLQCSNLPTDLLDVAASTSVYLQFFKLCGV